MSLRAERQPGDRPAAPDDLALVQAFINTLQDLDRHLQERLVSTSALADWLVEHGLLRPGTELGQDALGRALDVREGLRAMLFANNGCGYEPAAIDRLNRALRGARALVQLHPQSPPEFTSPGVDLDGALGRLAMIVAVAQVDGSWSRFKACPGRHCGWAFYDHSRNQTGRWCSMSVCGSRAKAREYRKRKM